MNRGDLVTIALQGDFGKPRPALVLQADPFSTLGSVTVLPVTSAVVAAPLLRVTVLPTPGTGLQRVTQVMIDKTRTVKRDKVEAVVGRVDADTLVEIERCLAVFLGIAK